MPRPFTEQERQRIGARLLQTARGAVAAGGFRRTTVATLARAAGISKGAFYRFFDSKEALFIALCQESERQVRGQLEAAVAQGGPSPKDRLRTVLRLLFDCLEADPMLAMLADPDEMAWLLRVLPPDVLAAARADDDRYFAALAQDLVDAGAMRADADREAFAALPSAVLAMAQQRSFIGERYPAVVAMLIDGLVRELGPA